MIKNNHDKPTEGKEIDGRKARWFDCNWNNDSHSDNACERCRVCRYLNFLDFVSTVGKPDGSTVEYDRKIDEYLKLETVLEKHNYILNNQ